MSQPVRLQKYFTDCGLLSRRRAEEEIASGRVLVNGEIASLGDKITPGVDLVTYRGRVVRPKETEHTYLLLNKPRGFVTTAKDEKGRPTVLDLVKSVGVRVYPVGRLDLDSDGLLILTDDGDHIWVDTNDIWDKGDLVGIDIPAKHLKISKKDEA